MPEETAASSSAASMDEKPCSSNAAAAAEGLEDVLEEAKKLIGTGNRHMVMGDVVSAVSVFQEACGMLAEKYGDTADECGEAFFLCGKALLELARMENTVLGNALDGVPEESSEEGEKQNDSKIESADNLDEKTRDELREQVYDAMAVKENENGDSEKTEGTQDKTAEEVSKEEAVEKSEDMVVEATSVPVQVPKEVPVKEEAGEKPKEEKLAEKQTKEANGEEKSAKKHGALPEKDGDASATKSPMKNGVKESPCKDKVETTASEEEPAKTENGVKNSAENGHGEEPKEDEEMAGDDDDGDDDDDDDDEDGDGNTEDKESEDEVGNLQLAWEMLEVAKVIYKRKEVKEDQLMMAQIFLKLGEVGTESGNYGQALDDFQECLALQLKHLPPHSRLLAETHYQLGITFSFTDEYKQAIDHFSSSIKVIETRVAMLQKAIDKAEEEAVKEERTELEELKQLLPEIKEKVEDAKESQRTAAAASVAIQQTMGGASTSSAFPAENGAASSSSSSVINQIPVKKPAEGVATAKPASASDISHLVRKKRKPEEESPKQDSEAKKVKQETTVNGSGDSASNGNGVQEKMEQEASA